MQGVARSISGTVVGGWAGNQARLEEAAEPGAMAVSGPGFCEVGSDPRQEKRRLAGLRPRHPTACNPDTPP